MCARVSEDNGGMDELNLFDFVVQTVPVHVNEENILPVASRLCEYCTTLLRACQRSRCCFGARASASQGHRRIEMEACTEREGQGRAEGGGNFEHQILVRLGRDSMRARLTERC